MWHWHTVEHFSALKRHEVRSCDHINEAWKHYPRWNKPNTKEQILYESTYRTHLEQAKRREAKGKIGQTSQWRRGRRERSYCLTNSYKTNKNTFCFPHCLLITPLSELLKGLFVLFSGGGGGCLLVSFWLYHVACGILTPQPGTEPQATAVKMPSSNHWTPRAFPINALLLI